MITGSSSGIGQAIAVECAKAGCVVLINYRKNKEGAQKTLKDVENEGGQGYIFQADLSSVDNIEKMFQEIREKKLQIDILVNNAGESPSGNLDDFEK